MAPIASAKIRQQTLEKIGMIGRHRFSQILRHLYEGAQVGSALLWQLRRLCWAGSPFREDVLPDRNLSSAGTVVTRVILTGGVVRHGLVAVTGRAGHQTHSPPPSCLTGHVSS